ncbi:MAG: RluA family pseudouridine synthase [Ruminococcaceae bacterium]|nr:RluA family pseudouridine synthase [Oscillospiraceae bacterium]
MTIEKVFEDEHIIVIIKPSGVSSEGGKGENITDLLELDEKPLVVHRLDKEVSGLMVLAKNQKAAALLSGQIQNGEFKKEYLAVVEGEVEERGSLSDLLFHDRQRNKTFVVKKERKGVKEADLDFERLSVSEFEGTPLSKVRIRLHTGRTHQIRVQFGSRKHPVFGDRKYGSSFKGEFCLFSCFLSFNHPLTCEKLCFEARPADIVPWIC